MADSTGTSSKSSGVKWGEKKTSASKRSPALDIGGKQTSAKSIKSGKVPF